MCYVSFLAEDKEKEQTKRVEVAAKVEEEKSVLEKLEEEIVQPEDNESSDDDDDAFSQSSQSSVRLRSHSNLQNKACDEKIHLDVRVDIFECKEHGVQFRNQSELDDHCKKVHKCKPKPKFQCNICKKRFSTKALVNKHVKEVHLDKKYVCDVESCGKTFKSKRGKQGHMELHVTNGKYKCEICGKTFGTMQTLTNHKSTHSDEKPYPCQFCGTTFKRTNEVSRHLNSCEKAIKARERAAEVPQLESAAKLDCVLCDEVFDSQDELNAHLLAEHKSGVKVEKFKCEECGKTFNRISQLTAHKLCHRSAKTKGKNSVKKNK